VAAVFQALRECDAVVIPSDPYDHRKKVKSPNRFTEALWAGRLVLAHPLPAYEQLADYGWVGEDLGEGLRWYAGNADAARRRIELGQAAVAERFTPQAVAAEWKSAIEAALEGR
jgi:glycosyltransferase involved in cell wall biosynthesis